MKYKVKLLDNVAGYGKAGQTIQLALAPQDVRETEEISTYVAGYTPQGFRSEEACPVIMVDNASDKFRTFNESNVFRPVEVRTSRQAFVPEVDPQSAISTYLVEERALGAFVPKATSRQSTFDVKSISSRRIADALALDREIRIFGSTGGLLTTPGNWNPNNVTQVGAGGAKWNQLTTADPIGDIQEMINRSAQIVTNIWMPQEVSQNFMRCVSVRDHLRTHHGDNPTSEGEKKSTFGGIILDYEIPGLPPIRVVPQKVENPSTQLLDFIFQNRVVLTGDPGVPTDGESIQTCGSFRERKESGNGIIVREYEVEGRGLEGGEMLVSGHAEEERMIATNVGGLIEDVLV